jgi:hypothetical protein
MYLQQRSHASAAAHTEAAWSPATVVLLHNTHTVANSQDQMTHSPIVIERSPNILVSIISSTHQPSHIRIIGVYDNCSIMRTNGSNDLPIAVSCEVVRRAIATAHWKFDHLPTRKKEMRISEAVRLYDSFISSSTSSKSEPVACFVPQIPQNISQQAKCDGFESSSETSSHSSNTSHLQQLSRRGIHGVRLDLVLLHNGLHAAAVGNQHWKNSRDEPTIV